MNILQIMMALGTGKLTVRRNGFEAYNKLVNGFGFGLMEGTEGETMDCRVAFFGDNVFKLL